MKITILDDDINMALYIRSIVEKTDINKMFHIDVFTDAEEMLIKSMRGKADIAILDVNLKDTLRNGGFVSKRLKMLDYNTLVIFVSQYNDSCTKVINSEPFRYVQKQRLESELPIAISDAIKRHYAIKKIMFEYHFNNVSTKVDLNEVLYFRSNHRRILIKQTHEKESYFYDTLDNVELDVLSATDIFFRANKSYLVNKSKITKYNKNELYIGQECISITNYSK